MTEYFVELKDDVVMYIAFYTAVYMNKKIPMFYKYRGRYIKALIDLDVWERQKEKWAKVDPDNPPILRTYSIYELYQENKGEIDLLYWDAVKLGRIRKLSKDRVRINLTSLSKLYGYDSRDDIVDRWVVFSADRKVDNVLDQRMKGHFKHRFGGKL